MNLAISRTRLIVLSAFFLVIFANQAFFRNVIAVYPPNAENIVFLISLFFLFAGVNILLFALVCFQRTTKPILILILLISSMAAYFMDTYNIIIDDHMIDNIFKTDLNESLDLLSWQQLGYFLFLGLLPAYLIYRVKLPAQNLRQSLLSQLLLLGVTAVLCVLLILSLSGFYATFFREHKPLRFYANPSYYIYSSIKYVNSMFKSNTTKLRQIATDAKIVRDDPRPKLIIFVVGETARADHFSLNGYERQTNPYLQQESVISFSNVWSCGTSTAHSLPCMFSVYGRSDFSKSKAFATENVLDILQRSGVHVIWLDNNSDSKGVALRIPYVNYKTAKENPICDSECRDPGMLARLQDYIDQQQGDIFIVLHQLGNHGPAYYKRYPKAFEKFTPTCQTNQLEKCDLQAISNAYDNALVYTDYFLSQAIQLLKANQQKYRTALWYVSDHGESLGENNLYLHGLPYLIAPDAQIHVPMILWFADNFFSNPAKKQKIMSRKADKLSHDHLFHSILGLMDVQTEVYQKELDFINHD